MDINLRTDLLAVLAERQYEGCAPVNVSIGYVHNGIVQTDGLLILSAPQAAVQSVMNWLHSSKVAASDNVITVSVHDGGLLIV